MVLTPQWLAQLPLSQPITATPVSGGDINQAYHLGTPDGDAFLLVQPATSADFYAHEIAGLKLLAQAVLVPEVLSFGQIDGDAYLVLSYLAAGTGQQADLGRAVASVHRITADQYGFDQNVTADRIPKINTWQSDWGTFYTEQRLDVLVDLAEKHGYWTSKRQQHYEHLRAAFLQHIDGVTNPPSLLHGDLWAGNVMFTIDGTPALIDPDVFYGDREFDLAMTTIFGGFGPDFYQGYTDQYPLQPGFQDRLPFYQLYYLLAHLNLFGEQYGPSVDRILDRY